MFPRVSRPLPYPQGHGGGPGSRLAPAGSSSASAVTPIPTMPSRSSGSRRPFPTPSPCGGSRASASATSTRRAATSRSSWLPDGSIGLLVGRHRAIRYLERRNRRIPRTDSPLTAEQIEEVRRALLVGLLRRRGSDRRRGCAPRPVARQRGAVPRGHGRRGHAERHRSARVRSDVREASRRRELPGCSCRTFVRDVQKEYDLVAGQMAARGYRVVRLPFEDHPVRAAVRREQVRRHDLGHAGRPAGTLPGASFFGPGSRERDGAAAERAPHPAGTALTRGSPPRRKRRSRSSTRVFGMPWRELDEAVGSPNPLFDRQRALYEANELSVVPRRRFSRAARAAFTACCFGGLEDLEEREAHDGARLAAIPGPRPACPRRDEPASTTDQAPRPRGPLR